MARLKQTSFLPDRFDDFERDVTYVGMHRERRVTWFTFLPIAVSVVAIALVVTASVLFIEQSGRSLTIDQSVIPQISADGPEDESSEESVPSNSVSPAEVAPITDPTQINSEDLTLTVLNGTETQGMAARVVNRLVTSGWPEASATNADSSDVLLSVVAYSEEADRGIALGIALELDLDSEAVVQTPAYPGARVTVVLGADYVDTEAT